MDRKAKKMKLPQQKASQNKKHSKSPKNISPKKIIEIEEKKENSITKFSILYVYRREEYNLSNVKSNITLSGFKKLISSELKIPQDNLIVSFMNKEIREEKFYLYNLVNNQKTLILSIKKKCK